MAMITWSSQAGDTLNHAAREAGHRFAQRTYRMARRTPMPRGVRAGLRSRLTWQPGLRTVALDQLLLGGQASLTPAEFAAHGGDPRWPSRRVVDGPHTQLLRLAAQRPLTDVEILGTTYADLARSCIAAAGSWRSATDSSGIVSMARAFIDSSSAGLLRDVGGALGTPQAPPERPVEVASIRDSPCFQVIDGHHRVAAAAAQGRKEILVRVSRWSVDTPLQELLRSVSRVGGRPLLHQPVDSVELVQWPTARSCRDRLETMVAFLEERGPVTGLSHLDVASRYGWFVKRMSDLGLDAEGVEQDPLAPRLGTLAYGLAPEQVTTGEVFDFIRGAERRWDVVSCFSLLHRFALGRGSTGAAQLVEALDRVTAQVLFIDTAQAHEEWFRDSLPEWDAAYIRRFLRRHTTFDRIIDLGPDHDSRPPFAGNYGRHLFACARES